MTSLPLRGDLHTAVSHLALWGLAAIADETTGSCNRLRWTQDLTPVPTLESVLTPDELAAAVHAHAQRAADPTSWVMRQESSGTRQGAGLFTARAKVPADPAEWAQHAAEVRAARRSGGLTRLDGRMIAGLGEPAWWRWEKGSNRPDEGASRWEMKTRNKGQEFTLHRLVPLAQALAERAPTQILAGLLGQSVRDETATNQSESRTATGLTTPGPVDSAIAWCALWGMSLMPPVPRKALISRTPGMWPDGRLHPSRAALPVFTRPVTVPRVSQVLLSEAFDAAAGGLVRDGVRASDPGPAGAARAWLAEQGVRALVIFPILKTDNPSAPERQILTGELQVLT